jgi:DNA-binding transcriptional regulator YdaS (Cro superfamily)
MMGDMSKQISPADRRRLAEQVGVSEQYLYQCLTRRRDMNPIEARRIEAATNGELMRWDLCQTTWRGIWPELGDLPNAPAANDSQPATAEGA